MSITQALGTLDEALGTLGTRTNVTADEATNWLLDIRSALTIPDDDLLQRIHDLSERA